MTTEVESQKLAQRPIKNTNAEGCLYYFVLFVPFWPLFMIPTVAQRRTSINLRQRRRPTSEAPTSGASFGEFTFVRTIYQSPMRGYGRRAAMAITAAAHGPPTTRKPTTTSSSACANGPAPI